MTLMKSKRPRVDHCSLTVAPSCSISLLTSRMRDGLFLTVWTPSGVRVVSMMYVGMAGRLIEQGHELRQASAPPLLVGCGDLRVGEPGVHERQLRRLADGRELHRDNRLELIRDAGLPAPRELQAPGRVDLAEGPADDELGAVDVAHREAVAPAGRGVELDLRRRHGPGAEPAAEHAGVGPGLEDVLGRGLDDAAGAVLGGGHRPRRSK